MTQRVLVTEPLAARGLDALRSAGLEVDERIGLSPEELLDAVPGAAALIIRSATRVTAPVLDAGPTSSSSVAPASGSTTSMSTPRPLAA